MRHTTKQTEVWSGNFGSEYTDRNFATIADMDEYYKNTYDISRSELNKEFLGELDRSIKILEIGANTGNQLLSLQQMGFDALYGVELQRYAVESSKKRTKGIDIIQGTIFDIPFKDNYFDLVYTSGVLIHIAPSDIENALKEIYRCSKSYIWGYEYFADKYTEVTYRGNSELLWKTDFANLYLKLFKDATLLRERKLKYLDTASQSTMFLLEKLK